MDSADLRHASRGARKVDWISRTSTYAGFGWLTCAEITRAPIVVIPHAQAYTIASTHERPEPNRPDTIRISCTSPLKPRGIAVIRGQAPRAGWTLRELGYTVQVLIAGVRAAPSTEAFKAGVHIADKTVAIGLALLGADEAVGHHHATIGRARFGHRSGLGHRSGFWRGPSLGHRCRRGAAVVIAARGDE